MPQNEIDYDSLDYNRNKQNKQEQKQINSGLFIIATPIGNLEDISIRALNTLEQCDILLCEDTRVSKKLLSAYGINSNKMVAFHEHNGEVMAPKIFEWLKDKKKIALISDAGTPLISDPGYKLLAYCYEHDQEKEINITHLPGPCSPIAGMVLSGLPTDRFFFNGFLSSKSTGRKNTLLEIKDIQSTLVFLESPHRIENTVGDMCEILGDDRQVAIVREITKIYEERIAGSLAEVLEILKSRKLKGEIIIIVEPPQKDKKEFSQEEIKDMLKKSLQDMKTKEASNYIAEITGLAKKEIYQLALSLKD